MGFSLEKDDFQKRLLYETEQDFADVAYQFYQLFSKKYPNFPMPNSLDFSEVASYLDPRKGGSLEHGHAEEVNDSESQQLIFDTAVKLGFVNREVVNPRNEVETKLGIYSDPITYEGNIEAIVVMGGAGETLIKRTYHALEAIKSGKVKTEKLILLTGYRNVSPRENDLLKKDGFTPGETEFQLAQGAISDLIIGGLGDSKRKSQQVVLGNNEYPMNLILGNYSIGDGKNIDIIIVDSPFNKKKTLSDGTLVSRATTEETFICLSQFLGDFDTSKSLYVVSHDIWQPAQMLFAQKILGKENGRNIIGSGPININRVNLNSQGQLELNDHGAVLSEINKYFNIASGFYQELKSETKSN